MTGFDNKELTCSLEKHYDKSIEDLEKLMLSKFDAIREAIAKSDGYATYRDNKQNEFRGALDDVNQRLADQQKTFTTKTDVDNLNEQFKIWMSGMKQIQEANFSVSMDKVESVRDDVEKLKNLKQGSAIVWPWIITIIMGLVTIASLVLKFSEQ